MHAVLGFVDQYGYAAVFVYMVLETSFLLHYVPSEVIVPFAASQLVHGPVSFALFVLDTTAGATVGSLLAYVVFGRYGREALERYGRYVHVTAAHVDRSEAAFTRYGESSVFWGRMLPFLRAFISIPAGLAGMSLRKFTLYSAAGAALFNTGLTYLVYTTPGMSSPFAYLLGVARDTLAEDAAYANAHTSFVLVVAGAFVLLAAAAWLARDWIRDNPALVKAVTLHAVRIVGLTVGGLFVLGALSAPANAYAAVTSLWDDPTALVAFGFSQQVALALTGVLVAVAGLVAYEVGELVELAHVRAVTDRVDERVR